MAVLFMDGFSHYANADILKKWTSTTAGAINAGTGRFGGQSWRFTGGVSNLIKNVTGGDSNIICGLAFTRDAVAGTVNEAFLQINHSAGGTSTEVLMNSGGTLSIRRNANFLATSVNAISANVYYHVEVIVFIHASAGTIRLRVNGEDWIALTTGLNTGTTGAVAAQLKLAQAISTTIQDQCDVYLLDGTGGAPWNASLGDCKIETLRPTGAGTTTQWTPSAGSNYQNVDESTPNGDTDYNTSGTPNQADTLVTGDLGTTGGTVIAVQTILAARKTDAGSRTIAPVIRHGGTDYAGTTVALSTTYDQQRQIFPQTPASTNWTVGDVNAAEFGYKLVT